jgi:UDP-glucose 4-epimerase
MERYRGSRLVALSTGNVYPQMPVSSAGASETAPLTPLGEYANSAVGRERIFEFFSHRDCTPIALLRLNYALDLRYGVLVDIARKVLASEPVDLFNGSFNCIWQGDANEMIIRSLALTSSPATAWNLTSPSAFSVRQVASSLGELLGKTPTFKGQEGPTALLSDASKICSRLGHPPTSIDQVLHWTAAWLRSSGRTIEKPTHFEVSDGRY